MMDIPQGPPVQDYDLLVPPKTLFGWGRFGEIGSLARSLGQRSYVICGSRTLERNGTLKRLEALLKKEGVEVVYLGSIQREPRVEDVDRLTARIRAHLDEEAPVEPFVIGIGGGAALDLAKAVTATATNLHLKTVKDVLEGVGRGLKLERQPLPMLAVPTTAGTGSECTKNAVISSGENDPEPFKKSLRSDLMVPRAVLVDPQLTVTLPPEVTARTGMDAITQLIESLISARAKPVPSALARHGLSMALPAVQRAVDSPTHRGAREAMAHAAYLSGIALANSGLGMAHGVAAALGIVAGVPHGLACAVMLPAALEANRGVREAEVSEVASQLTGETFASTAEAARRAPGAVRKLLQSMGIPSRLGDLGVRKDQVPALVQASRGNSMNGNPRSISDEELSQILENLL